MRVLPKWLWVFLLLTAAQSPAADGRLACEAEYGFAGRAKAGVWTPVTIGLTFAPANPAETLQGELRLYCPGEDGRNYYHARPVAMGPGRKVLTLLMQPSGRLDEDGSALSAAFCDQAGRELWRQELDQAARPEACLIPQTKLVAILSRGQRLRPEAFRPAGDVAEEYLYSGDVHDWEGLRRRLTEAKPESAAAAIWQLLPEPGRAAWKEGRVSLPADRAARLAEFNELLEKPDLLNRARPRLDLAQGRKFQQFLEERIWAQDPAAGRWSNRLLLQVVFADELTKLPLPGDPDEPQVVEISAEFAPDQWVGYAGLDALFWDDPAAGDLRPGQWAALIGWVRQGGRLIVTLASDRPVKLPAELAALLPAEVRGWEATPLPTADAKGQKRATPPPELAALLAGNWQYEAVRRGIFADLGAAPQDLPRLRLRGGTAEQPLVMRRFVGAGSLTLLALDPAAPPLAGTRGVPCLLGRCAGLVFDPADLEGDALRADQDIYSPPPKPVSFLNLARELLTAGADLRPPPLVWVAGFLLLYALAAGPLEHWLLSRRRALPWTWVTFPLIILLFALAAYAGDRIWRGQRSLARELVVLDGAADGPAGAAAVLALFPAEDRRAELAAAGAISPWAASREDAAGLGLLRWARRRAENRGRLPRLSRLAVGDPGDPGEGARSEQEDQRLVWRDLPLVRGVPRFFRVQLGAVASDQAWGDLHYTGRKLAGELRNASAANLEAVRLIGRQGVYEIGPLAAGATWSPGAGRVTPLTEYLAGLNGQSGQAAEIFSAQEPRSWRGFLDREAGPEAMDSEADAWSRILAGATLRRMLAEWPRRAVLARQQSAPPGLRAAVTAGEIGAPEAGLSLEQVWSAAEETNLELAPDLSELVREGGLVLLARPARRSEAVQLGGWTPAREEITLLRVIFAPAAEAEGGGLWRDDLYTGAYQALRRADGAR